MPYPPVDHVRLFDAGAQAIEASVNLGYHSLVHHFISDELPAFFGVEAGEERIWVAAVAEDARRVGQEDEFLGLYMRGHRSGRGVGVHIEPLLLGIPGE